jgi:hypothetical protein
MSTIYVSFLSFSVYIFSFLHYLFVCCGVSRFFSFFVLVVIRIFPVETPFAYMQFNNNRKKRQYYSDLDFAFLSLKLSHLSLLKFKIK